LGLVVLGHLLLDDLESLVDEGLDGLLGAGEDPDVLALGGEDGGAGVHDGDVLVVGVQHLVVTSGSVGEELDVALGSVEGGDGGGCLDLVGLGVVLRVQHGNGAVGIEGVASLLAVIGFPRHAGVSSLLVPEAHVGFGVEVGLEGGSGAGAEGNTGIHVADEGKGSENKCLEHSFTSRNSNFYNLIAEKLIYSCFFDSINTDYI